MSYKNQARDLHNPGTDITALATEKISGKTFVTVSAARSATGINSGAIQVATATAGAAIFGVAKYDAAADRLVGVARGHRIITVTAGAALTPGTPVAVGDDGTAVPAAEGATIVGIAVDAADTGTDAIIALG